MSFPSTNRYSLSIFFSSHEIPCVEECTSEKKRINVLHNHTEFKYEYFSTFNEASSLIAITALSGCLAGLKMISDNPGKPEHIRLAARVQAGVDEAQIKILQELYMKKIKVQKSIT